MKTTLIAAIFALGFAAAPAFAGEGRFGDNEVAAPNSTSVYQGAGGAVTQPGSTVVNSFPGAIESPIDHGQG